MKGGLAIHVAFSTWQSLTDVVVNVWEWTLSQIFREWEECVTNEITQSNAGWYYEWICSHYVLLICTFNRISCFAVCAPTVFFFIAIAYKCSIILQFTIMISIHMDVLNAGLSCRKNNLDPIMYRNNHDEISEIYILPAQHPPFIMFGVVLILVTVSS